MDIDILRRAFWDRTFSAPEAAGVLGLRRISGTLSRLKTHGLIEAAGRGRYRVSPPTEREVLRRRLHEERIRALLEGPVPVALDGPDAVLLWTEGGYRPPSFPGADVVHLVCARKNRELLAEEMAALGIPWAVRGEWPVGRGLVAIVRFDESLSRTRRDGSWVVRRREVLRIIRDEPIAYEGAEEWVLS